MSNRQNQALIEIIDLNENLSYSNCKTCKHFYFNKDKKPSCKFIFDEIDECLVLVEQLNLVP